MAVNFNAISNEIEVPLEPPAPGRSVIDEIDARQCLLKERAIKCTDIGPLYEKPKKRPHRYTYKYFCVCPNYNPQYVCQHIGNIVIDRDVLTPQEHNVLLATPKENKGAPRELPKFYQKKFIIPNCTSRVNKLAVPKPRTVLYSWTNFKHLLPKRHQMTLEQLMEKKPKWETTSITTALEYLEEEKRLKKVAKRMERARCAKLERKILNKQRTQIKKIICVLFEEMKDFLLNDQFIMDENSTLVAVILETLREFTDKEFYTTSNLREYQKILSFNLAVWINKFISNLNIHVAEAPVRQEPPEIHTHGEKGAEDLMSFLPVQDYIGSSESEDIFSKAPRTKGGADEVPSPDEVSVTQQTSCQTVVENKKSSNAGDGASYL